MTTLDRPGGSHRRLLLIDFDWQDADLLPGLLRAPGVSIRLVAGAGPDDPGIRVATLCGLPCSVELADLTREIFDVALVGERSPRREQLDRLLRALGTPVESPAAFVRNGDAVERRATGDDAGAPMDGAIGANGAAIAHEAWPSEVFGGPAEEESLPQTPCALPGPDDALGLERALSNWVAETAASAASLHLLRGESLARLCRSGPEDPLLEALVALAFRLDSPHVMIREDGSQRGRMWAAWPFRSERRHGVLAVAGAEATTGRRVWEAAVQSLGIAWSVAEHGEPPDPPRLTLLEPAAFTHRLRMAVDRHHAEGFHFALYRLSFEAPEEAVTELLRELPDRLRGTDCVCRPAPQELLLLCAGTSRAFAHVRRRIERLWRRTWESGDRAGACPAIADERIDLAGAEAAHEFLVTAHGWLGGR